MRARLAAPPAMRMAGGAARNRVAAMMPSSSAPCSDRSVTTAVAVRDLIKDSEHAFRLELDAQSKLHDVSLQNVNVGLQQLQ